MSLNNVESTNYLKIYRNENPKESKTKIHTNKHDLQIKISNRTIQQKKSIQIRKHQTPNTDESFPTSGGDRSQTSPGQVREKQSVSQRPLPQRLPSEPPSSSSSTTER